MQRIADYDVIQQLGEGSQGQVWLARTPERLQIPATQVALKTFHHAADDDDFDRLSRQMSSYAAVSSDLLVQLIDVGRQGTILFVASEYMSGGSLAQPARPLSRSDVLRSVADAAMGAHVLHEAGIAHRSIRPGNVLIGGSGAKLGDLGLSQLLNPGQTLTGAGQISAVEYLPPEVIQGQAASRASDIWALGATLHKVLTGTGIYPDLPSQSLIAALRHILNSRPSMGDALRSGEHSIIGAATATDPADRPATAEALALAIANEADRQSERV